MGPKRMNEHDRRPHRDDAEEPRPPESEDAPESTRHYEAPEEGTRRFEEKDEATEEPSASHEGLSSDWFASPWDRPEPGATQPIKSGGFDETPNDQTASIEAPGGGEPETEEAAPQAEHTTPVEPIQPPASAGQDTTGIGMALDTPAGGSATVFDEPQAAPSTTETPDQPFSLAPDEPQHEPVTTSTTHRRAPVRPWRWLTGGLVVGLVGWLGLFIYPWPLQFRIAPPRILPLQSPEPIAATAPPDQWVAMGSWLVGLDAVERPWLYNPVQQRAARASSKAPPGFMDGRFAVVAGPPIQRDYLELAWIEQAAASDVPVLRRQRYRFFSSPSEPGSDASDLLAPLEMPPAEYPFRPTPVELPGGLRLAALDAQGRMLLLDPEAPGGDPLVWRTEPAGAPLAPPAIRLTQDASSPVRLVRLTADHVSVFDPAGGLLGRAEWAQPMDPRIPVAMEPLRFGPGGDPVHWGWLVTDGRRLAGIRIGAEGIPENRFELELPRPIGNPQDPPAALTFPDGDPSRLDMFVVYSKLDPPLWYRHVEDGGYQAQETPLHRGMHDPMAADLNADGYWDLLWVDPAGKLRVLNGRTRRLAAAFETHPHTPPDSGWVWARDSETIQSIYFDQRNRPVKLELESAEMPRKTASTLFEHWRRRRWRDPDTTIIRMYEPEP